MNFLLLHHLLAALVLGFSVSLAAPSISAQNATVDALVYAFPLGPYVNFANTGFVVDASNDFATNTFAHVTTLANASFRTIILPNTDTLYSAALVDLSAGDVVVTMPEREAGRFYVLPIYDLFGNNVCSIGTAMDSTAGQYLIQYRPSNAGCDLTPVDAKGYAGTVSLPTVYGAILLRIEVYNSSDVEHIVSSIQPQFTLTPLNSPSSGASPLTSALLNDNLAVNNPPLSLLQLLSRVALFNPAEEASDAGRVAATLEAAGISPDSQSYTQPAGVDLASAYSTALNLVEQVPSNPANLLPLDSSSPSNWSTTLPSLSGDFHSRYDVRAFIGLAAYLQLNSTQAIYPAYTVTQEFFANQTYMVEFFGKPDVVGFWSLTIYDGDGFLVPNALNRYSLGDRANLTYPDGTSVYGNGVSGEDADSRSFYMLLQSTDVEVASEWKSNWLPTPTDGAQFLFILRFYGPTLSLTDGTYKYPQISPVDANPPLPSSE
ncbi:DUF1254-like protein [Favolaschia claudopus]|uniref:DUF1254-like protein n=1 Tax=Favolaschia claudopus TaxID=2862362 RepID=A0AAV9ZWV6_9AGAR